VTAVIEIRDVKKTFSAGREGAGLREIRALDGVSFSAAAGSFVSIVGPSGCGKSTLLEIVAGIQTPDSGSVSINGKNSGPDAIGDYRKKRKHFLPRFSNGFFHDRPDKDCAMVFQDFAVFPWMTVRENISFALHLKRMDGEESATVTKSVLSDVGLSANADDFPRQLSGGMTQRLGLARALAVRPKVLLLDEPFASVDAITRSSLQKTLNELWIKYRTTILLVTHDIEEAAFLSDRIIVLSESPGVVIGDLAVDIPRPRERTHAEIMNVKRYITALFE
jgi:NitT/TauT family transport system ATP-binding protein